MKRLFKRIILSILAIIPIASISFAAKSKKSQSTDDFFRVSIADLEDEFIRFLEAGILGEKYYDLLEKHRILTTEDLMLEENEATLELLLKTYVADKAKSKFEVVASASQILEDDGP